MGLMPQSKDKDWLNGYKNKTPIYAVCFLRQLKTYPAYWMDTEWKCNAISSEKWISERKSKGRSIIK